MFRHGFASRSRLRRARLALLAVTWTLTGGCNLLDPVIPRAHEHDRRATTPLIDYLYGDAAVPARDAQVALQLPLRVGLAFVPGNRGAAPLTVERETLLAGLRDRFRKVNYVADVVLVPDYYLSRRSGNGFEQLQQLASLHSLDLVALVSYDQVSQVRHNERAVAYWTIVGQFFVKGNDTATHTLLDVAIVEPRSRSLLLRAGGTSSLGAAVTTLAQDRKREQQRTDGFQEAVARLSDNFALELKQFEERVRAGIGPVAVAQRAKGGGGALDPLQLLLLGMFVVALARAGLPRRKRRTPRDPAINGSPAKSLVDSR